MKHMFWISNSTFKGKKISLASRLLAFFLSCLLSLPAFSCPCGCGSHSPLELSAIDQFKYKVSASREIFPSSYDRNGKKLSGKSKLQSIDSYQVSGVYALSPKFATFAQLGLKRNSGADESHYAPADPSFGVTWAFYNHYFSDYQLSLNSTLSFKVPSPGSDPSQISELESFSNGFFETSPAVGATLAYQNWAFLLNEKLIFRKGHSGSSPGLINKLSVGASYTFFGKGQVMASLEQELRSRDSERGIKIGQELVGFIMSENEQED